MRMAIVGLSLSLLAVPATAAEMVASDQDAQQRAAPKAANGQAAKGPRYCLQYGDVTGSRIRSVECRSKADWARLGVDVDHPDKE